MMKLARYFVPNPGTLLIVGLLLLVQSIWGAPSTPSLTQAPSATLISYQGRLADAGGNPLTGDYQMRFALYGVPAGGSWCWTETQTVSVSDGLFNVLLGSITAIDPLCLAGDVYLGITVGSDSEMTPRELLTSVPFAAQALTVPDGSVTSAKLNLVDGNVGIGTMNPGPKLEVVADGHGVKSTTSAPNAWAGLFYNSNNGAEALLAGPSGIAARFLNGNVGIGTADPKSTLDVAGTLSVNDRINLIRNGYYATIETDSAGGGSGATRLYFYGYDAAENRKRIAVFDGNTNASFDGNVTVKGDVYTPRVNSPQNTDLVIDAGAGSHNTLTLHDEVDIHDGDLKVGNDHKVFTSWLGSEGGKDLTIDAGLNSDNKIRLTDHLDMQNYNIERVNELWVQAAHCGTCTTGALVEANLQTEEELSDERVDRFTQGDLQCWSTEDERLELCTVANDRLVQSVADENGKPIVMGAELVKVIGLVKAGDLLVSSDVPGYATVNNNPKPGTVIAQALEDFAGKKGIIKAMIRKF